MLQEDRKYILMHRLLKMKWELGILYIYSILLIIDPVKILKIILLADKSS